MEPISAPFADATSAQPGIATRDAVASTGGRNTLIFRKRWSVLNEVSS
jgi:hypothetical protein